MTAPPARPANVLLLHYTSPPVIGGVESVLARHACHLARHGFRVQHRTMRLVSADDPVSFDLQAVRERERPPIVTIPAYRWERALAANGVSGTE